ncbi:MAG: RnfABCDGE type electron transport complex subunit B [Succinivibrio sp.]|nr:RnfABCDGE type electron transport complex subunit B [Succinivibrio sp.]
MPTELEWNFIVQTALCLLIAGIVLSLLFTGSRKLSPLHKQLLKVLPGMNCAQCGHATCEGYAAALSSGNCRLDLCTPGGPDTAAALGRVLGVDSQVPDLDEMLFVPRTVALIHESSCNGCGKCLKHCRVDAIEGSPRQPHRVLTEECIGCGDCVKNCPQECVEMHKLPPSLREYDWKLGPLRKSEPEVL